MFGLNLLRADKQESWRTVAADVETDRAPDKVISLNSYERQATLTSKFVQLRNLPVGAYCHQYLRRRRSRQLHTTHGGNRTDVEFDARRIAIVRAPAWW